MKYISSIRNYALALLLAANSSCSGFLEEYSQDLAKVEGWQDLDEVLLGGCYMQSSRLAIMNSYNEAVYGDHLDILHFMSDEVKESTANSNDHLRYQTGMFAFHTWQQDTGMDEKFKYVGGDEKYWNMLYEKINVANMVIALIDEQPEANPEDRYGKERVKGEAHFLRAAYYFLLVNLYGQPYNPATAATVPGVPVKLTEFVEDAVFERSSVQEVYQQILLDLETAEASLSGKDRISVYHADLTATHLLQSRVHLYMQNWKKAAEYADKVLKVQIDLLRLATKSPGEDCIYRDSPETIFSMGGYLVCTEFADDRYGEPAFYLSDNMTGLFNRNDMRSGLYTGETEHRGYSNVFMKVNGQSSQWDRTYEVSSCFLLRTPEAYLTLAEASAYIGDEETARRTLDRFLPTRMRNHETVTLNGNQLIDLIRNERAREFILEGHRWFDLRRYTVCAEYPWSTTIEHGHVYYADYAPDYNDWYRLEKNDDAYTLPIPREIRSFQVSLGNNERPVRKAYYTETY